MGLIATKSQKQRAISGGNGRVGGSHPLRTGRVWFVKMNQSGVYVHREESVTARAEDLEWRCSMKEIK